MPSCDFQLPRPRTWSWPPTLAVSHRSRAQRPGQRWTSSQILVATKTSKRRFSMDYGSICHQQSSIYTYIYIFNIIYILRTMYEIKDVQTVFECVPSVFRIMAGQYGRGVFAGGAARSTGFFPTAS